MKTRTATPAEIDRALYGKAGRRLDLETQLLHSVLDYFGVIGFLAFRRNVGAREWIDAKGERRLVRFGEAGQADVWAIGPGGLHIEVELKEPHAAGKKGEPREDQSAWLADVRRAGGIALCVRSLEELAERLKDEFRRRGLAWRNSWSLE